MQTISEVCLYFWLRRSQWATHLASHFPSLPGCPFSHFPSPRAAFLETKQDIQINNHNRPMVPCPWAIPNSRWGESINYSTSFLPSPSSSWPASCLQSFLVWLSAKFVRWYDLLEYFQEKQIGFSFLNVACKLINWWITWNSRRMPALLL